MMLRGRSRGSDACQRVFQFFAALFGMATAYLGVITLLPHSLHMFDLKVQQCFQVLQAIQQ